MFKSLRALFEVKIPYCVDCRFYSPAKDCVAEKCTSPRLLRAVPRDLVNGRVSSERDLCCWDARQNRYRCGTYGKFFKPKITEAD